MSRKLKLLAAVLVGGILIIGLTWNKSTQQEASPQPPVSTITPSEGDSPKIISTKPDPLEEAIVSANETIEITFNRPLENKGEFKLKIDPKIDFKIELSSDRKTAKIIPEKSYELGKTYTIFIGTETKFDGIGRWGEEKIFHFKTIPYRGV